MFLTPDELRAVEGALDELLARFAARTADPAQRPAGVRLVTLITLGLPAAADREPER